MNRVAPALLVGLASLASCVLACSTETRHGELGIYEPQVELGDAGPEAGPPLLFLTMSIRDFKRYNAKDPTTNPAFDNENSEQSVVAATLGDDGKPVYKAPNNTIPTFGKVLFDQWYNDTPGTNYGVTYPLPVSLTSDGLYEFDSQKSGTPELYMGAIRRVFTPIDDGTPYATPFGNQGGTHNLAFTGELHAVFALTSAGTLKVRSDDDLYVFIDKKLVLDLGGTHASKGASLSLDSLGLTVGHEYPLDLFYAERFGATGDLAITTNQKLTPQI
jgi:fibro-slime domain-containing protein